MHSISTGGQLQNGCPLFYRNIKSPHCGQSPMRLTHKQKPTISNVKSLVFCLVELDKSKLVDHRIVLNQLHGFPDDQIFQPVLLHSLFVAAPAPLDVGAFIIIVSASGCTGSTFTKHQRTALAAEQLGGQQIFLVCLATGRGTLVLIQTLLHPVKQFFGNDSRNRIRHNDVSERQFANVPAVHFPFSAFSV